MNNIIEFWNGSCVIEGYENLTFIFKNIDLGDPQWWGENITVYAENVTVGDFRTAGDLRIELCNATSIDTWYFSDRVKVKAVNSKEKASGLKKYEHAKQITERI
ncbi:MAG: hypothetical protein AB1779_04650 [Candidatus Thermoplasmatota archaeon]